MTASVPSNWLWSSSTFASPYSNPRTEGWVQFPATGQDTFTSKSRSLTPIKITLNSDHASFWLQKMFILIEVTLYDATGAVMAKGPVNSALGAEAFFESIRVTAGGELVENIPDLMAYSAQTYKNISARDKLLLGNMTGFNKTDLFANSGTRGFAWHPYLGFMHPTNNGPLHVWSLPNQSLEISLNLANISNVFQAAGVAEYRITNIRAFVPFTCPSPEYVAQTMQHINSGESLFYDYRRSTFTSNNCSGGTRSSHILHMSGVRSLSSFSWWYADDDVIADQTKDKALSFSSQGLKEWRIQLGPSLYIPQGRAFQHSANSPETLLISQLSNNSFEQLGDMDISFANYDATLFSIDYSFQSSDEGAVGCALGFQGTDGIVRLETVSNPAPSTKVRLITCYRENVTLAIGQSVQVI